MLRNDFFLHLFFITTLSHIIYNTPKEHTPKLQKKEGKAWNTATYANKKKNYRTNYTNKMNNKEAKKKRKENNNNNNKITIKPLIKKKKTPYPSAENTLKIILRGVNVF